ncbi:MAG: hydroxyisourate hydrolase [Kiritimatiellae bacterium]|nr:hydroxyisourate hydrolase [Kiritimatiellia bacterium]MCO5062565.1 hydroxyisourate hydrolase [Kiritimatiellia bacterium]MCO6399982.1 hydroxyisourate hydrolase [Verrucomicrobiota bacterium]
MKSPITTHVLDTAAGKPAAGVHVRLQIWSDAAKEWKKLTEGETNADGRITDWLPADKPIAAGVYRVRFDVAAYYKKCGQSTFFPHVPIVFEIRDATQHYHVPLLLSPYGYSTYRGS